MPHKSWQASHPGHGGPWLAPPLSRHPPQPAGPSAPPPAGPHTMACPHPAWPPQAGSNVPPGRAPSSRPPRGPRHGAPWQVSSPGQAPPPTTSIVGLLARWHIAIGGYHWPRAAYLTPPFTLSHTRPALGAQPPSARVRGGEVLPGIEGRLRSAGGLGGRRCWGGREGLLPPKGERWARDCGLCCAERGAGGGGGGGARGGGLWCVQHCCGGAGGPGPGSAGQAPGATLPPGRPQCVRCCHTPTLSVIGPQQRGGGVRVCRGG